jgi:transglutaminase-like putative cysteine protease
MSKGRKILDLAGSALAAAMLSGALTLVISGALGLSVSAVHVYALCGGIAAVTALAAWSRVGALAAVFAVGAGLLVSTLFGGFRPLTRLTELFSALAAMGAGEPAMLTEHADTVYGIVALVLTFALFFIGRMSGGVYPALTLSLIILLYGWFLEKRLSPVSALPALAALAAMFARSGSDKTSYLKALPAALVIAALAFAALPAGNPTWKPLEDAAERVRQMFFDYFMFTDARASYSLYADGYQPMGDALGGPAEPSNENVMLVQSDRMLLLRGSIRRTYTTYSWTNSAVNNRYLFIDPLKREVRDRVFESRRLDGLSAADAFEQVSASVTVLKDNISTLYVPHRLQDLSTGLDMTAYYNNTGEVFITRRVKTGDTYDFTALVPTGNVQALERIITAAGMSPDSQMDEVRRDYTELPKGIEQGVYDLAREITAGAQTPYQKARAIETYLLRNYTYSLDVAYPSANRDFVSHFLLDTKEGFCSYFASAMAVMARMVGLPSRYVEGYLVPAGGSEGTIVTGENAHAWVEIYFQGVGWVAFNPTPGSGDTSPDPEGEAGENGGSPDASPSPSPEPTVEPTEEPTAEPSEAPTEEPTASPEESGDPDEEQPDEGDQSEEPTPEPEDEAPEDGDSDAPAPDYGWFIWLIIILALLGLLAWWVVRRLSASDPARAEKNVKDAQERLALWYRAMLSVLEEQGQAPAPGETPVMYAERLKEANIAGEQFRYVSEQLALARYARKKPDAAALRQAKEAYALLTAQLKPLEKVRYTLRRLKRGLGDTKQIP